MKFTTLNRMIVTKTFHYRNYEIFKSKLEEEAYNLLKKRFQHEIIIYEWAVPGNEKMSIDFFVPQRLIAIECDGEQHRKFNKFFHGTINNFIAQQKRDRMKDDFCRLNNIKMLRIVNISGLGVLK